MDICWGEPIIHATGFRAQLLLPWTSDGRDLLSDNDMQQAFKELKNKGYRWARFKVTSYIRHEHIVTLLNGQNTSKKQPQDLITPEDQFSANLNADLEINWNELDNVEEINNNNHIMTRVSLDDGFILKDDMAVQLGFQNSKKSGEIFN